jgi:hypothetical protein
MSLLMDRLEHEREIVPPGTPLCRGTMLSRAQYLTDLQEWDYEDARLPPYGKMSPEHLAIWTDAIGIDNPSLGR